MLESLLRSTARLVQSLEPRESLCVLAARVLYDSLREHAIECSVLPCRVMIWNDALIERGAWCVGIGHGYPDEPRAPFGYHTARESYNGHLVVRVGDVILDPSLGQATDPAHHIFTGPLLAKVTRAAFFAGAVHFSDVFRWGMHPALRLTYVAEPHDLSYRRTPHWHDPYACESALISGS